MWKDLGLSCQSSSVLYQWEGRPVEQRVRRCPLSTRPIPGPAHRPRWMRKEGSPWSQGSTSALWVTTILASGRRYFSPYATAPLIYSLHAPGKILKKVLVPHWIGKLMRGERSQPLPKSPCKCSKALLKTYQHQQVIRTPNSTLLSNCPCFFSVYLLGAQRGKAQMDNWLSLFWCLVLGFFLNIALTVLLGSKKSSGCAKGSLCSISCSSVRFQPLYFTKRKAFTWEQQIM